VSLVLDFYRLSRTNHDGLYFSDYLKYDRGQLEDDHHYIQWLFPLDTSSLYSPYAPLLTESEIDAFKGDYAALTRMIAALRMMLEFYGLKLFDIDVSPTVQIQPNDNDRISEWAQDGNHNLLRLTRILKSLTLMGLNQYAEALLRCLWTVARTFQVSDTTVRYWTAAVSYLDSDTA
jgi:hypothetical protein